VCVRSSGRESGMSQIEPRSRAAEFTLAVLDRCRSCAAVLGGATATRKQNRWASVHMNTCNDGMAFVSVICCVIVSPGAWLCLYNNVCHMGVGIAKGPIELPALLLPANCLLVEPSPGSAAAQMAGPLSAVGPLSGASAP